MKWRLTAALFPSHAVGKTSSFQEYALQFRGTNPDPGPWKLPRSIGVQTVKGLGVGELPEKRAARSRGRRFNFNLMVCGKVY